VSHRKPCAVSNSDEGGGRERVREGEDTGVGRHVHGGPGVEVPIRGAGRLGGYAGARQSSVEGVGVPWRSAQG
jgi:hypothetical protein